MAEKRKYENKPTYQIGRDFNVYNAHNPTFASVIRNGDEKFSSFREPFHDKFDEMIRGNTLIEIGAGSSPQKGFWQYGPKEVILVEPTARRSYGGVPEYVKYARDSSGGCDGVTYLDEDVEDNSVVVASAAVFDKIILCDEDYARNLVSLIQRKTIPGGLTLHSIDDPHFVPMFTEAGFEHEPDGHLANLYFFRKPGI